MPNYVAVGSEFTVNSVTFSYQEYPDFAKLTGGRFVAVWESTDGQQDNSSAGLKGRMFGADGVPIGPEFAINTATKDGQKDPSVAGLTDGGFVVTWSTRDPLQDGSSDAIKAQRFDVSGAKVGPEFLVNSMTSNTQWQPAVASLDNGGFVITWETYDSASDGSGRSIKAQIYNAAGVRVGGEFLVNTITADEQMHPEISALSGGGFVAVWHTQVFGKLEVRAQVFDSTGAKLGGEIFANTQTFESQTEIQVATLANGGFVITWTTFDTAQDGSGYAIKAQLFNAAGAKVGGEFLVNTATASSQKTPTVAGLSNGDFVIAWRTDDQTADDSSGAIKAQVFSATGAKIGGELRVSSAAATLEIDPVVVDLGNGAFAIGWTGSTSPSWDYNIKAQIFSSGSAPVIVSNGGGSTAALTVAENETAVTTVSAVDPDGAAGLIYSITGGADASRFAINASTGVLTFVSPRNFESRQDVGSNNVYDVVVTVSDGVLKDSQALAVTISDVNEAPTISGSQTDYFHIENRTAVATFSATDPEGAAVTWSIAGGADAARFAIDPATGALRFVAAPDFEAPGDVGANNFYNVTIAASDGSLFATRALVIEIANWNEGPVIVSGGGGDSASVSVPENTGFVTTIVADDPDANNSSYSFSIAGGADAALFIIHAQTGQLFFKSNFGGNFEAPGDVGGNNVYDVIVSVSDGFEPADTQAVAVTVTNVNEAPTITSNGGGATAAISVVENNLAVTTVAAVDFEGPVTYSIAGGADASRFLIDGATGALTFLASPDYEQRTDADGNNVYLVTVRASDGTLSDTQALSITVLNANERPIITSNGGGTSAFVEMDEGSTYVATVVAADPDGTVAVVYSITGGAHAGLFEIDAATGILSFVAAPDYEAPLGESSNVYSVTVTASDGQLSSSQSVQVSVRDVNEGVVITSAANLTAYENLSQVGTVTATDLDGDSVSFAIAGGADGALFEIDAATGALSFLAAPDHEAPADSDGDNVYEVEVSASDGSVSGVQAVTVTVGNVDEPIEILSYGGESTVSLAMNEGGVQVGQVEAEDPEGAAIAYAIAGGADASLFSIDSATGVLRFVEAPDYETPLDTYSDNIYEVIVTASDGELSRWQFLSVLIGNVNEAVTITSSGGAESVAVTIDENHAVVASVSAVDADGTTVLYSIAGGADAALFGIDPLSGALRLTQGADYEAYGDADGDNVYEVIVAAGDGWLSDTQAFSVTVADVDEPLYFTSYASGSYVSLAVGENSRDAAVVAAEDPEGSEVVYSIVDSYDGASFTIDAQTGVLQFLTAPDHEAPADLDGDNVYTVLVAATDGHFFDYQTISITVGDVDEPVEILSYGGAAAVALTVEEGSLSVGTVEAEDAEDWLVTYSITGGADAALFRVDAHTGALAFTSGIYPDFEAPADAGGNNVYDVVVTASSSTSSDDQAFAITVANRNEGLWITSDGSGDANLSINEGNRTVTTVTAYDQDGDVPTYSIVGGADSALFAIDSVTGVLTFIAAPDYEAPNSGAGTNFYTVEVGASDGEYLGRQKITVGINNVNEGVTITSGGGAASLSVTVAENGTAVTAVAASDADGDALTYSILGGADSARFAIDAQTGALRFVQAPNFEAPADAGGNNVYDVVVSVTDGAFTDSQAVAVTVSNLNEAVAITSNGGGSNAAVTVAENGTAVATVAASDPDGQAATYAIAGGADAARFTINASTGVLAFVSAPNFEAPVDAGANNVYDVVVSASDGSSTDTQALAVTVGNVNEAVVITSNGGGASAAITVVENDSAAATVAAVDIDGGAVTYAIAGGADSGRFSINAATGVLAFLAAPNFEAPSDLGANNVYDVVVSASDGTFVDTQALAVRVLNASESPVITSNGGGASGAISIAENVGNVTTVAATDPDGTSVTYSIVGGADAARFKINALTGALQFVVAPDWELPSDSNLDNVYAVVVRSSDGQLFDEQALNVTVTNTRDGNNVTGTSGGDTISATSTNIALRTSNEEDLVFGRDGNDTISGMAGDDELYGEAGNDVLIGGEGADKLLGGLGKDQFTYNAVSESSGAARDLIMDFSRSQADKISLSAIDANSVLSGNQAFAFIGTSAFSNTPGQLRYETSGGTTTIFGDVNGDGVADLQIQVSGSIALVASDFVL